MMQSEETRYKLSLSRVGSNPTATRPASTSILENALNNPVRKRYGFNALFAGLDKAPKLPWEKWQKQPQSNEDIQAYYDGMGPDNVTCWGFVCGYKNLESLDFDWAWVYRLWKDKFGARAETLTVQTPNGGLRPHYICGKPETHDEFKESLHVELKGPGRFVVYEGKASREDGSIGEYTVVMDKPVREDDNIIADTLAFLEETRRRYHFLFWNCLRPHFSKKRLVDSSHNVRLFLADIMVCDGFGDEEIFELYRDFQNFDYAKTEYQIRYTRQRVEAGLKPPTCETLRQTLGWSEENCKGCPRKGMVRHEKGIALGNYRLELRGAKALVYDKNGQPVWSHSVASIDGYYVKKDLSKKLDVDEATVDRAVAQLIEQITQPKTQLPTSPSQTTARTDGEVNLDIVKEAEALLQNPALLHYINKALDSRLCREYENRLFMAKAACGARQKTSIVRLEGPNAVGKKMLYYWLPEFFGEENVVIMTGSTFPYWKRKALEGWDSRGKIIVLVEERGDFAGATKYAFEQVYSEDKIVLGMNIRNEEGEWEPVDVVLQGPLLFITSSTEPEPSLHGASREWSVTPDDSEEQTRFIDEWWRERELLPTSRLEEENRQIKVIRDALSLLKPYEVKIPFIKNIQFPLEFLMDRRKARDFDNLIRYSAFLHQGLRPIVEGVIYALPHDYYIAERIARRILAVSRGALTTREESILRYIREHPELATLTEQGKPPSEAEVACYFRVKDLALTKEYRNVPERTLRDWLNSLAKKKALTKIALSRSNVLYCKIPGNNAVDNPAPFLGPFSLEDYISALSQSCGNSPPDMEAVVDRVKEMWNQPFIDPISGEHFTVDESTAALPTSPAFPQPPTEPGTGSFNKKKPAEVAGSPTTTSPRFKPEDVTRLARLYPAEEGECDRCRRRTTLDFQVETEDGIWGFVCLDCADRIKKANPEVEWLE